MRRIFFYCKNFFIEDGGLSIFIYFIFSLKNKNKIIKFDIICCKKCWKIYIDSRYIEVIDL